MQLTGGQLNSLAPVFSPDGKKLYVIGQQLRGELVRYDSKSREWVPYLSGISADFVDFSKDGQWVAYTTFPEETLWRSRVDGSERLQLTFPPMQALMPRWSPDSKQIAFLDVRLDKPWKISLISAEGGTPESVLNEQHNEMDPTWSPDGNSLAFSYVPWFEAAAPGISAVYIVDLRTRKSVKLTWLGGALRTAVVARWSVHCRQSRGPAGDHALRFPDKNVDGTGKERRLQQLVKRWAIRLLRDFWEGELFIACPRNRSPIGRGSECKGFPPNRVGWSDLDRSGAG